MSEGTSIPPPHSHALYVTITTTIALLEQFSDSITRSDQPARILAEQHPSSSALSALALLSASAVTLKAQSTKLSLLTLTPPFTPSAVSSVLSTLNSSVLPSLLTAALLVADDETKYTASFSAEVRSLVKATLRDLHTLISCVERRSKHDDPTDQLDEQKKNNVTEAVGRVWESCDDLASLADGGIGAFVVKKAEMWLGLIKDAAEELKEWDPEEDGVDGLIGEGAVQNEDESQDEEEKDGGAVEKAKLSAMKVLTRVPQSLHVVVKQRLRKLNWKSTGVKGPSEGKKSEPGGPPASDANEDSLAKQAVMVDQVLKGLQHVSETVDEMAEALYMGELNRSSRLVRDVWEATVDLVEVVRGPTQEQATLGNGENVVERHPETTEDKYIRRALDWIRAVDPQPLSSREVTNGSMQEVRDG